MEPDWTGTFTQAIVLGIDFLLAAQAIFVVCEFFIYSYSIFLCCVHILFFRFLLCEEGRMCEIKIYTE